MKRLPLFAVVVLAFDLQAAVAGGTSYQVRISAFSGGERTKATFIAESSSEEIMPGCKVIEVVTEYRLWRWPWSREETFTREAHRQALARLREAHEAKAGIRFGIMGMGLGHESSDGPCAFRSRALATVEEEGGTHAVYSLYKDP